MKKVLLIIFLAFLVGVIALFITAKTDLPEPVSQSNQSTTDNSEPSSTTIENHSAKNIGAQQEVQQTETNAIFAQEVSPSEKEIELLGIPNEDSIEFEELVDQLEGNLENLTNESIITQEENAILEQELAELEEMLKRELEEFENSEKP